jgi:hypothetical protein
MAKASRAASTFLPPQSLCSATQSARLSLHRLEGASVPATTPPEQILHGGRGVARIRVAQIVARAATELVATPCHLCPSRRPRRRDEVALSQSHDHVPADAAEDPATRVKSRRGVFTRQVPTPGA